MVLVKNSQQKEEVKKSLASYFEKNQIEMRGWNVYLERCKLRLKFSQSGMFKDTTYVEFNCFFTESEVQKFPKNHDAHGRLFTVEHLIKGVEVYDILFWSRALSYQPSYFNCLGQFLESEYFNIRDAFKSVDTLLATVEKSGESSISMKPWLRERLGSDFGNRH